VEILAEERIHMGGKSYWTGYTKEYLKVMVPTDHDIQNQLITVTAAELIENDAISALIFSTV